MATSSGSTGYTVHLGVFSTAGSQVGVAALPKPGVTGHSELQKEGPASEALVRVVEGLVAQRHHCLSTFLEGAPIEALKSAGFPLSS